MSARTTGGRQHEIDGRTGTGTSAGRDLAAGKQTLTGILDGSAAIASGGPAAAVQRSALGSPRAVQASRSDLSGPDVAATAERGVAAASAPLPHFDAIQRAFGRHDVSGVRAQVGGQAAEASKQLGAEAYATGDRVAFATAPDLHTATHEAVHVVQQAGGVQLKDGIGDAGDVHEQHADAVADAVVAGRSAEAMLDGVTGSGSTLVAGRPGIQRKAVQLVAAGYKSSADLQAMTLSQFDAYASAQADWATSSTLGADKEKLRGVLGFARGNGGRVLGACGDFAVADLVTAAAGTGTAADAKLAAYSRAASVGKNTGTIHVEAPATSLADALKWGDAIVKLEHGIGGVIIERVITQNATYQGLKALVNEGGAGVVNDFVTYVKDVKPLLDARDGTDIRSYIEFHREGGQAKYAGYKTSLPEIRNYHRFTVPQLQKLVSNRTDAAHNKTRTPPLPICVVLQSAFDHNGAFHRDPFMTLVINRSTHITLVAEGKDSLGAFGSELTRFAAFGKDGKVDEVMVSGHGDAKDMELAGDKGTGNVKGKDVYHHTAKQDVTVNSRDSAADRKATDDFITVIKSVLRDDPGSRVVLNACLTASNSIGSAALDPDPDKAAKQIKDAIAAAPSLTTAMQAKLGSHHGQVLGANASFGKVSLLDAAGHIDIVSTGDPKMTASKLEYVEGGTEPTGMLRATLESWATDRAATIAALNRRIAAKSGVKSWRETLIRSLSKLIVADKDNAGLISTLTDTAEALGGLLSPAKCQVARVKGHVPDAHLGAIFTALRSSDTWTDASRNYVPLVVFQVWIAKDGGKVGDFLGFLDASTFNTQNAAAFLDLAHLQPTISQLLPAPGKPPAAPPRGSFLIALLYLVRQGKAAPAETKAYIKQVVGSGGQTFPPTCHVDQILKGAPQRAILESAGVVAASAPVAPTPNVAPTGVGNNTLAVDSVTRKCTTYGFGSTNVYMLPAGNKIGSIPSGTTLHVIGTTRGTKKGIFIDSTDVDFLAVEYTIGSDKTVFVDASDVRMS